MSRLRYIAHTMTPPGTSTTSRVTSAWYRADPRLMPTTSIRSPVAGDTVTSPLILCSRTVLPEGIAFSQRKSGAVVAGCCAASGAARRSGRRRARAVMRSSALRGSAGAGADGDVTTEALGTDPGVALADLEGEPVDAVLTRFQRDGEVALDGATVRGNAEHRPGGWRDGQRDAAGVRRELIACAGIHGAIVCEVAAGAFHANVAGHGVPHRDVAADRARIDVAAHVGEGDVAVVRTDFDIPCEGGGHDVAGHGAQIDRLRGVFHAEVPALRLRVHGR